MTTSSIRPGDIVEVDKKGRCFLATVQGRCGEVNAAPASEGLAILPIAPGVSYRSAKAREVKSHWRKRRTA